MENFLKQLPGLFKLNHAHHICLGVSSQTLEAKEEQLLGCYFALEEAAVLIMSQSSLPLEEIQQCIENICDRKLPHLIKEDIDLVKEELSGIDFVSLVIFGSYAEGKQTEKSDLDLALFVNSAEDKRNCELSLKSDELKALTPLDAHVIPREEMLQMLKDKQENLGKQIARKHFALHNPMIFYAILAEGINNGFKLIYS